MYKNGRENSKTSSHAFRYVEVMFQTNDNTWCYLHLHSKWGACIIITKCDKTVASASMSHNHISLNTMQIVQQNSILSNGTFMIYSLSITAQKNNAYRTTGVKTEHFPCSATLLTVKSLFQLRFTRTPHR
jgi:beta-xylosidase